MTTIDHYGQGFRVRFSFPGTGCRGYKILARDLAEVELALRHHYSCAHASCETKACPLCRLVHPASAAWAEDNQEVTPCSTPTRSSD